jgi:NAD(P)-dependent dehydrogenase (short-subunit alcohol dehydrogenase family)
VNVKGTFLLSKEALSKVFLPKKRGVIVNTASTAGLRGIFDRCAYTASKHAIVGLTRAMAVDHVKDGVRVNCICPGTTMTPWIDKRLKESADPKAALATLVARQPMGRLGTPEEMAAGILYLASDEAAFATGTALIVDGGYCA